jgi:hypothetical protein
VRDCHELGEHRPFKEHIVCHLKIGYLKLHILDAEVFQSPIGHGKSDLVDGGCHYSRDYSVEQSPTWMQRCPKETHLVKSF